MKQISSVVCVVARLAFGISLAVGMVACSKSEAEHAEKSEGSVAKVVPTRSTPAASAPAKPASAA